MTSWGKVRSRARIALLMLCAVTIEWAAPPPAHAWFGWLDKFSGPGRFHGFEFDLRLYCFGEANALKAFRERLATARYITATLGRSAEVLSPWEVTASRRGAAEAWAGVLVALGELERDFPAIDIMSAEKEAKGWLAKFTPPANAAERIPLDNVGSPTPHLDEIENQAAQIGRSLNTRGALWAVCSPDKRRRWSVEFDVAEYRSYGAQPLVAGGEQVRLVTVMPALTYSLFDMVDVGAGVGAYRFSSRGFDTFSGAIAAPLRLSLHAPRAAFGRRAPYWRFVSSLEGRFVLFLVPSGFGARVFDSSAGEASRIPGELVHAWGVWLNVNELLGVSKRPVK